MANYPLFRATMCGNRSGHDVSNSYHPRPYGSPGLPSGFPASVDASCATLAVALAILYLPKQHPQPQPNVPRCFFLTHPRGKIQLTANTATTDSSQRYKAEEIPLA